MMSLNVELLESSFKMVAPKADDLANAFYDRLFREHPEVRPMFPESMDEQKKHLVAALAMVVNNLRNPETLTQALNELGLRHIGYGVQREQYPVVGQTLLAALSEVAGSAWTPELEEAWSEAYEAIQSIIYKALDQHRSAA